MERDNITPEEKLLKIIEGPAMPKFKIPLGMKKMPKVNLKNIGNWLNRLQHIDKNALSKYLSLRLVNKAIAGLCGFLTVFWIFDFMRINSNLSQRFEQIAQAPAVASAQAKETPLTLVSYEEITSEAKRRNIFTLLPAPPKTEADGSPADIAEKISNLKLVGVIWSNNPQVMIEDVKGNRTYLLSIGEQMGEITIKKIFMDKVVLQIEGQEEELR
jgi:type II secretory pathway component PulC